MEPTNVLNGTNQCQFKNKIGSFKYCSLKGTPNCSSIYDITVQTFFWNLCL